MRLPASVVCFNVGPRPAWRIVRSIAKIRRDERPDAIALFEAHRALPAIRRKFRDKWHIYATADVVLLVRKDCEQPTITAAGHDVDWWGPKEGLEHQGREHMIATWGDTHLDAGANRSENLRWVLMHGVPGGPSGGVGPHLARKDSDYGWNRKAWRWDLIVVRNAVRDFPGGVLLAGDLNATTDELTNRFKALNVTNIPTHAHVDHAAQRGLKVRAARLEYYGSDHPAILLRPVQKEKRP